MFQYELNPLAFTSLEGKLTSPSKAAAQETRLDAISCMVAVQSPSAGLRLQQPQWPLEGGNYPQCQGLEAGNTLLPCPYSGNMGFLQPWRVLPKLCQAPKHLSKRSVVSVLSLGRSDRQLRKVGRGSLNPEGSACGDKPFPAF